MLTQQGLKGLTESEGNRLVAALGLQEVRECCSLMEDGLCCSLTGECEHPEIKPDCRALPIERLFTVVPAQLPR